MISNNHHLGRQSQQSNNNSKEAPNSLPTCSSCLTQTELQALRDAFSLFDTEGCGRIRISELKSVLRDLSNENNNNNDDDSKRNRPSRNLEALLSTLEEMTTAAMSSSSSHDQNDNNNNTAKEFLTMDDFIRLMTEPNIANPSDSRDELEKVFDLFDEDRKGYISLQDLRKVATDLGESMTDEELHEMIARASTDGKVTLAQFRDIMNKKLFS